MSAARHALFASAVVIALAGCESIRTVEVPAERSIEVPGTGVGVGNNPLAPSDVFPVDFGEVLSEQMAQSFSTEGVDAGAVESMELTRMRAEVQDPEENGNVVRHLGFLTSMDFSLGAPDTEPVLVAFSDEGAFDDDPVEYEWELTGEELAPIVQASDQLEMVTDVVIERRPTFATTIVFSAVMTVIVDPLGAL